MSIVIKDIACLRGKYFYYYVLVPKSGDAWSTLITYEEHGERVAKTNPYVSSRQFFTKLTPNKYKQSTYLSWSRCPFSAPIENVVEELTTREQKIIERLIIETERHG